jgi:hypothetical protein
MSEIHWEVTLITVTFAFSAAFVVAYGLGAEWWRSIIGRALIASDLSLATLVGVSLTSFWFDYTPPAWVRLTLYVLIAVAAAMRFGAALHLQWLKRRRS